MIKLGSVVYVDEEKFLFKCFIVVYYSNSFEEFKVRVKKLLKLNDGFIRVVLVIFVLSFGVNFKDVRYIIYYGFVFDLRIYL